MTGISGCAPTSTSRAEKEGKEGKDGFVRSRGFLAYALLAVWLVAYLWVLWFAIGLALG